MLNFKQAQAHFFKGDTRLSSKPVQYRMDFTHECNLNCPMCLQNHTVSKARFPAEFTREIFDEKHYAWVSEFILVGGEPLVIPESIEFIRRLSKTDPGECQLTLSTNGLLLDKFWPEIRKFKNVLFAVSLDSCDPKTYESIRIGSSWQKVLKNILEIERTRQNDSWRGWQIVSGNLVMKSTIQRLPELVRFAHKHKFDNRFTVIWGLKNRGENIFVYNWLLDSIPKWKENLDEAVELADKLSLGYPTRANLTGIRRLLLTKPWVIRSKALMVAALFGKRELEMILLDKVKSCLSSPKSLSRGSKFLIAIEEWERRYKGNRATRVFWKVCIYPVILIMVFIFSVCKFLSSFIFRQALRIRKKIRDLFGT